MRILKWDSLPPEMQTDAVRKYYDILRKKRVALFFKRVVDVVVSLLLLGLFSPLFLLLALFIKLDSRGPVFYRQVRVTQYGRRFRIFKFRSMKEGSEGGSQITREGDARVTRVGRVIRRWRLDELAQLIDVLRGKMTLVGTRPEVPRFLAHYTPEMLATLLLPAGITSMASIYYKDEAALLAGSEDSERTYVRRVLPAKMYYNLRALENFSFWGDMRVMVMTVLAMLGKEYRDGGREK